MKGPKKVPCKKHRTPVFTRFYQKTQEFPQKKDPFVFTEKRVVYFHRKSFFYHRIKVALFPRKIVTGLMTDFYPPMYILNKATPLLERSPYKGVVYSEGYTYPMVFESFIPLLLKSYYHLEGMVLHSRSYQITLPGFYFHSLW